MAAHQPEPLVSVVIPNCNGAGLIEACLPSLQRETYRDVEILVVDNASRDDSIEIIRRLAPQSSILPQKENLGGAGGVNAGVALLEADHTTR